MQTQHTPGPWAIANGDEIHDRPTLRDEHGARIGSTPNGIATVHYYPQTPVSTGSMDANARLIAAAPELLAALQEIVANPDMADGEEPRRLITQARAAIAKATI